MSDAYAVIMAGGSGTRFWPRSRKRTPKQLMPFVEGDRSLLQETVARLEGAIPAKNVYVVTNEVQADQVRNQLPGVPAGNVIEEPCGRNTGPCIALAAECLAASGASGDDCMLVLPADHYIADVEEWREVLKTVLETAAAHSSSVVVGIPPTRPHTGYGYLKFSGREIERRNGRPVFVVEGFKEKPDLETARMYLREGDYMWNSGCFCWRLDTIRSLIETHIPQAAEVARRCASAFGTERFAEVMKEHYPQAPSISIDYGVMEKCDEIHGIKAAVGWNDVGSWQAVFDILPLDGKGNVILGDTLLEECEGCLAWGSSDTLVAMVGCRDLVVVHHDGAVLVCPRDKDQQVRRIVERLEHAGREDLL